MFSFAKVEEKKKYLLLLFLTILTLKEKSLYAKSIALNIICGKGQQNRLRRQKFGPSMTSHLKNTGLRRLEYT